MNESFVSSVLIDASKNDNSVKLICNRYTKIEVPLRAKIEFTIDVIRNLRF